MPSGGNSGMMNNNGAGSAGGNSTPFDFFN
jgi:hypothetical protein